MKAASLQGIPLIGDVHTSPTGKRNIVFAHYDRERDLSPVEQRFLEFIVLDETRKLGHKVHYTLDPLRFDLTLAGQAPPELDFGGRNLLHPLSSIAPLTP